MKAAAALALLLLFSGCAGIEVGKPSGPTASLGGQRNPIPLGAEWAEQALGHGPDHDHTRADQHHATTPNFELLGYDPLISSHYGTTAFGNFCGDATATLDGRRIAIVESRSDVGFTLADVTDPRAPKFLGELVMRSTYVYDLAVVPDGRHVVLVTSSVTAPDPNGPPPLHEASAGLSWRPTCSDQEVPLLWAAEDPVPRPLSLLLVDISNPAQPTIIDQRPIAGPGHGLFSTILDGRTWILASINTATSGTGNYEFYELITTPAGARLNLLSIWTIGVPKTAEEFTRPLGHNDGWIVKHPGTGQTLAWLAHWNFGLFILDLADPKMPRQIGHWTDYSAAKRPGDSGQTHSIHVLPELWDGRHYTLTGPEHPSRPASYPTGLLWVLDTTDPTKPFEVGVWTLPHDVQWSDRLHFSLHYITAVNRTAFVSAYHAGIWALDLTKIGTQPFVHLDAVGVFMPDQVSPNPPKTPMRWAPTVEEVLSMPDGSLVTFDANSGLYTFRFDASQPMPPPLPWNGAPTAGRGEAKSLV